MLSHGCLWVAPCLPTQYASQPEPARQIETRSFERKNLLGSAERPVVNDLLSHYRSVVEQPFPRLGGFRDNAAAAVL